MIKSWNIPLILFTITNLVVVAVSYGVLTTELSNNSTALVSLSKDMKEISSSLSDIREHVLVIETKQAYDESRILKLESKHP